MTPVHSRPGAVDFVVFECARKMVHRCHLAVLLISREETHGRVLRLDQRA